MKHFYGWINVAVLVLIYMLLMMAPLLSFGVILAPLTANLGISKTVASFAYTLMSLISGVGAVAAGVFAKKIGNRNAICCGAVLVAVGSMIMYLWCSNVIVLYICYVCFFSIGLTIGTILPINTIITQWFSKYRGIALSIVSCGAGIGGIVINPIMANIVEFTGNWRNVYLCLAAFALASLGLGAFLVKECPQVVGQVPDGRKVDDSWSDYSDKKDNSKYRTKEVWTLKEARKTSIFYFMVICIGVCSFSQTSINTHAVSHLSNCGLSATLAATVVGSFALSSIPCRLISGFCCDRINPKIILASGLVCMAIGIIVLNNVTSVHMGYFFAIIAGIGYGFAYASLNPIVANCFGAENFGMIYGGIYSISALINASAPTIMGACYDLRGEYSLSWMLLIALLLIAFCCSLCLRIPRKPVQTVQ